MVARELSSLLRGTKVFVCGTTTRRGEESTEEMQKRVCEDISANRRVDLAARCGCPQDKEGEARGYSVDECPCEVRPLSHEDDARGTPQRRHDSSSRCDLAPSPPCHVTFHGPSLLLSFTLVCSGLLKLNSCSSARTRADSCVLQQRVHRQCAGAGVGGGRGGDRQERPAGTWTPPLLLLRIPAGQPASPPPQPPPPRDAHRGASPHRRAPTRVKWCRTRLARCGSCRRHSRHR